LLIRYIYVVLDNYFDLVMQFGAICTA